MNRRRGNTARVAWNGLDIFLILLTRKMHEVLATNPFNPHPDFRILSPQWRQNFYGTPSKINNDYRRSQRFQTEPSRGNFAPSFQMNIDALRQEEEALGKYFRRPENIFDNVHHKNFSFKDASYMEEAPDFDKKYNMERSVHFDETGIRPRYQYQNPIMGPNNQMMGPNNQILGPNNQMMGPNNQMMGPNNQMMGAHNHPVQRNPANPIHGERLMLIGDIERLSPEDQQKCIAKILELEQIHDFCNIAAQIMHIVDLLKRRSWMVRLLLRNNVKHANIGRPSLVTLLNRTIRQLTKTNEKMRRMLGNRGKPPSGFKQPKWIAPTRQKSSSTPAITTVVQTTPSSKPETTTSATTITQTTTQQTTIASTVPSTEETSKAVETATESASTSESTAPAA